MKVKLNNDSNEYVTIRNHYSKTHIESKKKVGGKPRYYLLKPMFLDTETSHNHDIDNPIGWLYQWCFEFNNQIVGGRTPSTLISEFAAIRQMYQLDESTRLVCYIHNASYDLAYLIPYLLEDGAEYEVLAVANHKIISLYVDGIEFRCSYRLSNMSLDTWAKKMETTTRKMVGAVDYDLIRYQDSELTMTDWEYMVNDVITLKEAFYKDCLNTNDDVTSIPLTSTGYVRRDCRHASRTEEGYRKKYFDGMVLNVQSYKDCRCAFQGGITHGNRHYANKTLVGSDSRPIEHCDFKSHYPSRQQLDTFPESAYVLYYDRAESDEDMDNAELFKLIEEGKHCLLTLLLEDVKLKKEVTCPCLSASKILNYGKYELINEIGLKGTDNGKVINAIGYIGINCNDIDLYWILRQYDVKSMIILRCYTANYGRFPQSLRDVINQYFKIKETLTSGIYREKSKNKLNGIYGMTATDPVRTEFNIEADSLEWSSNRLDDDGIEEALNKYYASRNNFLPYQFGMVTTSWARHWLLYIIADVIGYDNYIYCDTDSAFYFSSPEIEEKIRRFNSEVIAKNIEYGLGVENSKGTMSYYGTFEHEERCDKFRFLHAKCYALEIEGKLQITIAGVTANNKQPKSSKLYMTREQELGSIDNLDEGFVFEECGGTMSTYTTEKPGVITINGHVIEYASACIINRTTKELGGIVEDYSEWEVE